MRPILHGMTSPDIVFPPLEGGRWPRPPVLYVRQGETHNVRSIPSWGVAVHLPAPFGHVWRRRAYSAIIGLLGCVLQSSDWPHFSLIIPRHWDAWPHSCYTPTDGAYALRCGAPSEATSTGRPMIGWWPRLGVQRRPMTWKVYPLLMICLCRRYII